MTMIALFAVGKILSPCSSRIMDVFSSENCPKIASVTTVAVMQTAIMVAATAGAIIGCAYAGCAWVDEGSVVDTEDGYHVHST